MRQNCTYKQSNIIDAAKDPAHSLFKIYTISVYFIHSDRVPYSRVMEKAAKLFTERASPRKYNDGTMNLPSVGVRSEIAA
jgi:hypothetical protein